MKKTRKSVTRSTHKLLLIPTTQEPKLREPGASYRSAVGRENLFSKEPLLQAAIVIWRRLRGGHLKPFVPKKFCIQLWKPMVLRLADCVPKPALEVLFSAPSRSSADCAALLSRPRNSWCNDLRRRRHQHHRVVEVRRRQIPLAVHVDGRGLSDGQFSQDRVFLPVRVQLVRMCCARREKSQSLVQAAVPFSDGHASLSPIGTQLNRVLVAEPKNFLF